MFDDSLVDYLLINKAMPAEEKHLAIIIVKIYTIFLYILIHSIILSGIVGIVTITSRPAGTFRASFGPLFPQDIFFFFFCSGRNFNKHVSLDSSIFELFLEMSVTL